MKKLLILVDFIGPKKELFAQIVSQRVGEDTQVVLGKFSHLFFEIGEEVKVFVDDTDIKEFDLVYLRRVDHSIFPLSGTLALCLDYLGIRYFDTRFKEIGSAGDKLTSLAKLFINGVSVPRTVFCTREMVESKKDGIISELSLPIIAKDTESQGNTGIYLIKSKEDFGRLLKETEKRDKEAPTQFIFQQFIDIDKEYRLLVLGKKVGASHTKLKRTYDKFVIDYKDPIAQVEFVSPSSLSNSLKETAIKAANALNIEIAGVDVCIEKGSGRVFVFEVNRGPGFEYNTKVSPEVPAVADFFKKELAK